MLIHLQKKLDAIFSAADSPDSAESSDFEELAHAVFEYQYENNLPYRRFAKMLDRTPASVKNWRKIPAVPTGAFKSDFPLMCQEKKAATFHTSGTTSGRPGAHHFPETQTYEASIVAAWEALELPKPERAYFLSLPPVEAPHSSLIHMFGTLQSQYFSEVASSFLQKGNSFNLGALRQVGDEPIIVMGTALAFLHVMEMTTPIPLPQGSHLLETGGYKNSKHTLTKEALYEKLTVHFSVPTDHLINEYSMTELSSQAYTYGLGQPHRLPGWCRARVIDPATGSDLAAGETGYLVLHDLANLHSVAAIRTQDFATRIDDRSFLLHGRDTEAAPRGCSLTAEDLT